MIRCDSCRREFPVQKVLEQVQTVGLPQQQVTRPPHRTRRESAGRTGTSRLRSVRSSKRNLLSVKIITFALVLVMAAIAIGFLAVDQPASQQNNPSAWVGRQVPYFSLPEVNGSSFILQQYTNKSNVLLFFNEGLTCSPCLQQMVDLSNDYKGFQSINVTLVAITSDSKANLAQWA